MQSGLAATLFSIAVIGAFALTGGGLWLLIKRKERKQGLLMLLAALVLAGNVAVWTL
jgi:LPXTG-motif cell wall-anchored protein